VNSITLSFIHDTQKLLIGSWIQVTQECRLISSLHGQLPVFSEVSNLVYFSAEYGMLYVNLFC